MPGVAVVAMALSGVAVVAMAWVLLWWTMGVAVVDHGVAWCCCGDHGVAVVTMVLLW